MSDATQTDLEAPATRAEVCAAAIAECFRGDGEILCNPIGIIPMIGGRLARATFEPYLVMTDGFAAFTPTQLPPGANPYRSEDGVLVTDSVTEYWNPYPNMFTILWNGRRHVMMGASQVDQYGNQNIACIGDWHKPKAQLLGFRGAPGNTINHTTSYWIPNHNPKSIVAKVDVVSGVGYDRAAALDPQSSRFHEIRRVVSNLGVFDFDTDDHRMRVRSVHPGVTLEEIQEATAFELVVPDSIEETRLPTAEELHLIRMELDPKSMRGYEVKN